jgi:hypothetical protein
MAPGAGLTAWVSRLDPVKEALINVMPAKPVPEFCNRGAGIQQEAEISGFPLSRE